MSARRFESVMDPNVESNSAVAGGGSCDAESAGARDAARRARSLLETYLPLAIDASGAAALGGGG